MDGLFSADIGEGIFVPEDDDEIVLCLNYDGKFGLNNMNLYFQNANTKSEVYSWAEWILTKLLNKFCGHLILQFRNIIL